jgi:hypothetical protein
MDHTKNLGVNRSAHERQAFASNKTSTIILISRPVSYLSNVASFSVLSIFDFPFGLI